MDPITMGMGGSLLGGVFSMIGQNSANQENEKMMYANQDFQRSMADQQMKYGTAQVANQQAFAERMSSTAYQRSVADLKAAGLNPMLAYMNGGASSPSSSLASTPSGGSPSMPNIQNKFSGMAEGIQNAVSNSYQARRLDKDLQVADVNMDVGKATKTKVEADAKVASMNQEILQSGLADRKSASANDALRDKNRSELEKSKEYQIMKLMLDNGASAAQIGSSIGRIMGAGKGGMTINVPRN